MKDLSVGVEGEETVKSDCKFAHTGRQPSECMMSMRRLPFPTILPNEPMMLGKNMAMRTVFATCIPIKTGHMNFLKPSNSKKK